MNVVRHYNVAKKKESHDAANIIEDVEEQIHFGRAEKRHVSGDIGGDKEDAIGLLDAAKAGHNRNSI
jgi:hypothetical protein